jgi:hypothetical protein
MFQRSRSYKEDDEKRFSDPVFRTPAMEYFSLFYFVPSSSSPPSPLPHVDRNGSSVTIG